MSLYTIESLSTNADPVRATPLPGTLRPAKLRVAIIHYWLVEMRGGEKVLEALCRMFPDADIFTHVYRPDKISPVIRRHTVRTTSVARLPMATRLYQKYLPFMPGALEELDLRGYDLIISSEAGPAKGVIAPPDALHLCYCHSPMRYLWDQYHVYRAQSGFATRQLMSLMAPGMRSWDVTSAARVDGFAANSSHVSARIRKYWRRDSDVVFPPVSVEQFAPVPAAERGGFYLWAGELAPYKRPDIAIKAFNELGKPLVVIGGPDKAERMLAREANKNIRFLGRVPFSKLRAYLASCKALIFPGEEDFGMVPVEAMASGRPVIAYGRGGALETVIDGVTGLHFQDQSVAGLVAAVHKFEADRLETLDPQSLVRHANRFNEAAFRRGMAAALTRHGLSVNLSQTTVNGHDQPFQT